MNKKETVKLLFNSVEIIEKIEVPHRHIQKQLEHMVETIYEEIMIELIGTDIHNHVMNLEDPFNFIKEWANNEN